VSLNADTIEFLLSKGLTGADLLEVARRSERRSDPTAAERMRNMRARKKAGRVTRNVTNEPPNDNTLTPVPEANASVTLEPAHVGKHRLPADWQPKPFSAGTCAEQTVQRWEPGRLERELAKFRDHHTAAGTRWENWQAAWSKWVNNSDDFQRGRSGQSTPHNIGKSAAAFAALAPGDEPF